MIRAVLDANVVVAAMLNPRGLPAELVGRVRDSYPGVYEQLALFYRQDPAARRGL